MAVRTHVLARSAVISAAWSAGLATVVVGPMMGKGWVVLLDWAIGPRISFTDRLFAGDSLPAGPVFFGTAALLHGFAGAAVGWLMPWIVLFVAGVGAAKLVSLFTNGVVASMTAATAYIWNPFVHERLYAGQLAVLLGYAIVPFVGFQAIRLTHEINVDTESSEVGGGGGEVGEVVAVAERRGKFRIAVVSLPIMWAVAIAASIHYAVLGGFVLFAIAVTAVVTPVSKPGSNRNRRLLAWFATSLVIAGALTFAWLGPIVRKAPPTGNEKTIATFATRPDPQIGLVGGVALQRGFWRPSPGEPSSDRGWWWPLCGGALSGSALLGFVALWRKGAKQIVISALIIGVVGWSLGQGGEGVVGPVFRSFTDVPGMRIMREAGKFIALVSLAWCIGLAGFAEMLVAEIRAKAATSRKWTKRALLVLVSVATALAPISLTPGLAWGVRGRLAAVRFPQTWKSIAKELDSDPKGRIIVLPFVGYFDPGFTNHRVVKHLARAYFGSRVILSDDAKVEGLPPSPRTVAIAAALRSSDPGPVLARIGIEWIVGAADRPPVTGNTFERVFVSGDLAIYRNTTFSGERG